MAVDFNSQYHALLLKQVPVGARRALDVGCGTGRFARLLAERGLDVEGIDGNAEVIEAARAAGGGPHYRNADIREHQLPDARYDFISCIASLHHMPFETVLTLRKALAPEGVLAVVGLYPARTPADFVCALPALTLLKADRLLSRRRAAPSVQVPVVWPPPLTYAETRAEAARLLPGSTLRRLLLWRYLLLYRA
ncbi:bifunctional 2-polyprenyl-6-hydroxyphenol methylase/3-demethylubiquinol 3-O-methyltransferase UbiG [Streptomyces sp. WMMB 322]|uniref:class I SAM-dependent methyltransferase n=1 Tax=Streptomyces sp. WMMB 322 TaxID=1286821 RepID=UPI0006E2C4D8|nr:class I SAM-dependent methyltransferase [Streptomyces sp. WMMB 322]SCK47064.1 Methyltransferase domain-containing protein [Streptomyces sp. WMMB 322]